MLTVQIYEPLDLNMQVNNEVMKSMDNPFYKEVIGAVSGPRGCTMSIPGFYKGDGIWCVRFSARYVGDWKITILSSIPALSGTHFTVQAIAQSNPNVHGLLQLDPEDKHHFRYEDGTPYFLLGYEMNWLWAIDQISDDTKHLETLMDNLSDGCFNHFLVNAYAYDTHWATGNTFEEDYGPPPMHPWEGGHEDHDYSKLNVSYWNHFDRMMKVLWERGMVIHLYFKVYNKKVKWPEKYSREEELYFDYIVARYQAFPNLVWDFSKESYLESDKAYILQRLQRVKQFDAYSHLVTIHDCKVFVHNRPYQEVIDFITDQQHSNLYHTAILQRELNKPVFNCEFSYEHGPVTSTTWVWGCNQSPEECVQRAYEVVMAGGYPAHYYTSHAWDVIVLEARPVTLKAYRAMYELMTSLNWKRMNPVPHHTGDNTRSMLNKEETEMIIYAPTGKMRFYTHMAGTKWRGYWMDIMTGEQVEDIIELKGRPSSPFIARASVGHFHKIQG